MPLPTLHQLDTAEEEVTSDLRRCRRRAGSHASRESLGSLMARMSRGGDSPDFFRDVSNDLTLIVNLKAALRGIKLPAYATLIG
ncbi:hypothetical protein DUI87_32809 [Hirundo rustica rustica]|uniref:Uncharacterized protein n=1 Tax=Hirundo rustica rustica TaxID=333673 RepID=A0A3M0IPL9_HIRRU|nr:hypothetical protein DUI87_32809 [Hirundo rustica rustica]